MNPGVHLKFGGAGEGGGRDFLEIVFDANAYEPTAMRRFSEQFMRLLELAINDPGIRVADALQKATAG